MSEGKFFLDFVAIRKNSQTNAALFQVFKWRMKIEEGWRAGYECVRVCSSVWVY